MVLLTQGTPSTHLKKRSLLLRRATLPSLALLVLVLLIWGHVRMASMPFGGTSVSPLVGSGRGAGGVATSLSVPAQPALCGLMDVTCTAQSIAQWAASEIQAAFQPITDAILKDPANILYQTPLLNNTTDPQNQAIIAFNSFFVKVVDLAFASLLVIAGYNAIVGRHLNLPNASLQEMLPRAVLVVMAVHFNLFFLEFFLGFENALAQDITQVAGHMMLTDLLLGLLDIKSSGLIAFLLLLILTIMLIMLLIQMITRIALVAISLAFAPLGLSCFLLSQTTRWGRLWLTTLSSSVMVQCIQLTALGLGGVFITAFAATPFVMLDKELASLFLAIGTLGLVLKIPGMLQTWSLHPMVESGSKKEAAESGTSGVPSPNSTGTMSEGSTMVNEAGMSGPVVEGSLVAEEGGAAAAALLI